MLSLLRDGVPSILDHDWDPIFEAGKVDERPWDLGDALTGHLALMKMALL